VTALLLPAVEGLRVEAGVALAANHLVAVGVAGEGGEGRLDESTAQTQHQVEGGLLLDVVVAQRAAILELLAREDKALLIRRDPLLVLDLGLDILDRIRRLDFERDGFAREGLHKDLHRDGYLLATATRRSCCSVRNAQHCRCVAINIQLRSLTDAPSNSQNLAAETIGSSVTGDPI
jgi:hypothetical protein